MINDYLRAVLFAARGQISSLPIMLLRVLYARIRYGMGPKYFSLFALGECEVSKWADFLLDRETNPIIRSINGKSNLSLAVNKVLFTEHCIKMGLPTIPILFVVQRPGSDASGTFLSVSDESHFKSVLESAPDQLFVKLTNGAHGDGAFIVLRTSAGWSFCDSSGTAEDLFQFCLGRIVGRGGVIFQPVVHPHPMFTRFMPFGALGTVRAVTFLSKDGPKILLPLLRIPAGGNVTDNFSEGASGNLVAQIELTTGVLASCKMSRSKSWPEMIRLDRHPETNAEITGFKLPYWDETVELMLRAQESTPQLRTLGWDIAITDGGPIIVEANTGYDVNLLQVAYGRGVRKDLAPIVGMRN